MFKFLSNDKNKNVFYKNNHHQFDRSYKVIKFHIKKLQIIFEISLVYLTRFKKKKDNSLKYIRDICSSFSKKQQKTTMQPNPNCAFYNFDRTIQWT